MGVWEISEKNSCPAKSVRKKILGNCGEINLASAFTAFNRPGPVIDFKKKLLHKLLPTKKSHAKPKGEKKIHASQNCPPLPYDPLKT